MEPGPDSQQPISAPTASPPEVRNFGGWISCAAIFALLVFAQLSQYLGRAPEKSPAYESELTKFELAVMMQQASGANKSTSKTRLGDLDEDVSLLAKERAAHIEAAKLYAVIRHEQGYPLDANDVQRLSESKDRNANTYAKIYGPTILTTQDAVGIEKDFAKGTFADKMAVVHAYEKAGDTKARGRLLDASQWTWRIAVIGSIMIFGALGVGLLALYAMRRLQGQWQPLGHPALPMTAIRADANAYRMALFLAAFMAVPLIVLLPIHKRLADDGQAAISALIGFVMLLIVLRISVFGHRSSFKEILGDTSKLGNKVLWGIGGAIANVPIVLALGLIGVTIFKFLPAPSHPAVEELMHSRTPLAISLFFFSASIMAPLMEETSFRGLLLPALAKLLRSPSRGIFWSSVAFALIHPQGPSLWLPLMAIGAMGSLLAYQTRSLIPSMVMHAVHNTALLILTLTVM